MRTAAGGGIGRATRSAGLVASVAAVFAAQALAPAGLRAQEPDDTVGCRGGLGSAAASVQLPPGHWAVAAVRRAEALGLLAEPVAPRRTLRRATVARLLCQAERSAPVRVPALAALARGWVVRYAEEFGPGAVGGAAAPRPMPHLRVAPEFGYALGEGLVAPGFGEFPPERTGSFPLAERNELQVSVALSATTARHFAVAAAPALLGGTLHLPSAEAVAGAGAFTLALGRQTVGFGWAEGGNVVLSGAEPFDAIQFETTHALRLPRPLSWLGSMDFQTFLSQFSEPRHPGNPYVWGASGAVHPHPRVTLAVHRAALFGGARSELPITPKTVLQMLIGEVHDRKNFEDQVVSVEGRFRLPTEAVIPLTLYAEWGSEDAAGAWRDVAGIVAGVYVPRVPGVPPLALGVEHALFRPSCCFNPPWYRHVGFPGSWVKERLPLGHGLGGEGLEWLLYGRAELLDARLELGGRGYRRERGAENLYSPERAGISVGGAISARWRLSPRADLRLLADKERGSGWTTTNVQAGVSAYFFR